MKLTNYINEYLYSIQNEKNLDKKTIKAYEYDLTQFNNYYTLHNLTNISNDTLKDFLNHLRNQSLSDNSIKRKLITIRNFTQYLMEKKYIPVFEMKRIFQKYKTAKKLPKTITIGNVSKILTIYSDKLADSKSLYQKIIRSRDLALVDLIISTGIRISEASNLNIRNIDLQTDKIIIYGKNRKERIVFLSSEKIRKNLNNWLTLRHHLKPNDTDALFVNKYGNRLSIYGISNVFHKYDKENALLKNITPHRFRHTFATELLNNGANLRDVQEILGHSSISTTQIYTQVTTNRKREVFEKYNYRNFLE